MRKLLFAASAIALLTAGAASAADVNATPVQINPVEQIAINGTVLSHIDGGEITTQAIANNIDASAENSVNLDSKQLNTGVQAAVQVSAFSHLDDLEVGTSAIANNVQIKNTHVANIAGGVAQVNAAPQIAVDAFVSSRLHDVTSQSAAVGNNYSANADFVNVGSGAGQTVVLGTTTVTEQGAAQGPAYGPGEQGVGAVWVPGNGPFGLGGHFAAWTPTLQGDSLGQVYGPGQDVTLNTYEIVGTPAVGLGQVNVAPQFSATVAYDVNGRNVSFGAQSVGNSFSADANNSVTTAGFGTLDSMAGGLQQANFAPQVSVGVIAGSRLRGDNALSASSIGNTATFEGASVNVASTQLNAAPQFSAGIVAASNVTNLTVTTASVGNNLTLRTSK